MPSDAATTAVGPDAAAADASRAARDAVAGGEQVDAGFLHAFSFFEIAGDYAVRAKHFMDAMRVVQVPGSATFTPTGLTFLDDAGTVAVTPDRLVELQAAASLAASAASQALTLLRIEKSLQKLVQQADPPTA